MTARKYASSLLKKPSMASSTSPSEKCDFRTAFIFNGLQPPKTAVLPCTVRSLPKNRVVRQAASRIAGFTLIEVMVALVVAALALGAVAASVARMADNAFTLRERTYASWVAQNKIVELRLANVLPEVSKSNGEVEFAGREWAWDATISETGIENLFRVDVVVSYPGTDDAIWTMAGFIGEPGLPGVANQVWSRGAQAAGQTN
jgi:general secretion pathway protein I